MIPVKITINDGAKVPAYQTEDAAGADVFAHLDAPLTILPGETKLIPTGVFLEIPRGYEAQIRPRSGLAIKNNITILNSPGTIDADYRGEVKIIVTNLGTEEFTVTNHMRIAQMVFSKVYTGHFIKVDSLTETGRSHGGFGHSGV